MVWNLNDGGSDNCALVAAAGLYSHVCRSRITSGELMIEIWKRTLAKDSFKKQNKDEIKKVLDAFKDITRFNVKQCAICLWDRLREDVLRGNMSLLEWIKHCNRYGGPFVGEETGIYDEQRVARTNSAQVKLVDKAARLAIDVSKVSSKSSHTVPLYVTGKSAEKSIKIIQEQVKKHQYCMFALLSEAIGHWLVGYARGLEAGDDKDRQPWAEHGMKLDFADYQPSDPIRYFAPFVGIAPRKTGMTDSHALVIVPGFRRDRQNWPAKRFSGISEHMFMKLVQEKHQRGKGPETNVFEAETQAQLKAETSRPEKSRTRRHGKSPRKKSATTRR